MIPVMTALLALALAAQAAIAQTGTTQPAPATPAITAPAVAAAMQPRLPQRFGLDFSLVAAVAEGDLLILTFDVGPETLRTATPAAIAAQLPQGFCSAAQARAALEGPMSLRADARLASGEVVRGTMLQRCPAATN